MSPRTASRRWVGRALLFQFMTMMPVHAIRPMVSYRAIELGAGSEHLGIVAASYAALALVLAVPLGGGVDRLGEPRFLMGGGALVAGAGAFLATADSLLGLIAAQALLGLGQVVSQIGLQALLANGGRPEDRDRRFGAQAVMGSLGQMVGPTAAALLYDASGSGFGLVFLTAAATAGVGVAVAVPFLRRPPPRVERTAAGVAAGSLYRNAGMVLRQPMVPHAMLASVSVLTTVDLLIAYLPLYGEHRGIAIGTVGLLLSARAGAAMASRLIMGPLVDRIGRNALLVGSMVLPTVCLLVVPFGVGVPVLFAAMVLAGAGLGLGQPLSLAWVTSQVPIEIRGLAIGVRLTGNRLGQLVVPAAVGVIAGAAGPSAVFVAAAAMLGGGAAIVSRASDGTPWLARSRERIDG